MATQNHTATSAAQATNETPALFVAGIKVLPDGKIGIECAGEIDAATADRAAAELFRLAFALRSEARAEIPADVLMDLMMERENALEVRL